MKLHILLLEAADIQFQDTYVPAHTHTPHTHTHTHTDTTTVVPMCPNTEHSHTRTLELFSLILLHLVTVEGRALHISWQRPQSLSMDPFKMTNKQAKEQEH